MSETNTLEAPATTTEQPKAKKPARKPAAKKAKPTATKGESGMDRSHDVPWSDKKVTVFKALKQCKAIGATNAVSAVKLAEKSGLVARDIRHYCYHAKAAGLVGVATIEDIRGYGFYLTAKGAAINPTEAQKAEQKAKSV